VFADKELKPEKGVILCDLRTIPARLFEIALPGGKHEPSKRPAAENLFGPHLRDIALSADGKTAVLNSFNWDQNLYGIDLANGEIRWRGKVGDTFAFDPGADAQGFTVQGFDLLSAEGYHLYTLDTQGKVDKRFALYGLPNRATNWACAGILQEPGINAFAESPDGSWIAAAGNLGLIVWDRKGNELWNDSWWKTSRKHVRLVALDAKTLVVLDGTTATARNASNGERLWSLTLADSGELRGGTVSGDRKTLVIHADTLGGRLFVIRAGRLVNTIVTAADEVAVNADGSQIAVTGRRQLKVIDSATGLLWSFTGDDHLHHPRISPDGKRVAVGSELGTLTVLDINGKVLSQRDLHAWPIPTWLPDNDLLVATWMGQVARFDSDMIVRWQVKLTPGEASSFNRPAPLSARPPITTVRKTGWGNATDKPLPLTPNLLSENKALIGAICNPKAHGDPRPWQNKIETLTDGKADAPPKPWLEWTDINYIDSGWRSKLTLEVDAFRTQLHLTGITFVEDPEHPESWLRDMRLEWWDAAKEAWIPGPYLLSNSATHSHVLDKPIEAAKFRFVSTGGGTWPIGNIRLAELVFHGQTLGCSHPDVVAKRPVAVLFDESETDLACMTGSRGYRYTGAFSGGKCFELKEGTSGPEYRPPFGHAIPNWDFEIAEKPEPGQYRFLRFAWKAGSDKTTGMSLLVGRAWPGGGIAATIGDAKWKEGVIAEQRLDGPTPKEWQEVTIDLWKMSNGKPPRIQALMLSTVGGSALFDRIVLARTEADLPKAPSR
jgi:outer membrane protein assembly factor BamB